MRDDGSFEVYAGVCETGEPLVDEITFDTPFAVGYARGTLLRRTAKLGDGLIVLLDDVTEQRRTEAELRGYAHAVAHDLSEPIAAMAVLVTLLERRRDDRPDPEVLRLLRDSVGRARQLVDGVLEYARAGQVRRDRVDLGALMGDVEQDLSARLAEAEATIEVRDLPEVSGDAGLLRRVLQNLVGNAAKFRGDAPPTSRSRRASRTATGSSACATGAWACRPRTPTGSSGCSPAPATTRRGTASDSPCRGASSRRTVGGSGSSRPRAAAAPSASRCRAERRRRRGRATATAPPVTRGRQAAAGSRKPVTERSRPSSATSATSRPVATRVPPPATRCQEKRTRSWWASGPAASSKRWPGNCSWAPRDHRGDPVPAGAGHERVDVAARPP